MIRYRACALLLGAVALSACDKNAVQDITGSLPDSQVRFFNFGVNAPGVNFYADNTKMTAISSATGTESNNGVVFGNVGASGLYSGIDPGQHTLTGRIAAATDKDLPISSVQATLEAGKRYSFYQSGVYNPTAKTVDAFIVEDPVPAEIDHSVAYVRFVNAIWNSDPMTLSVKHTVTGAVSAVGGAVVYESAGTFTPLAGGSYDLSTRIAGDTAAVITRTAVGFLPGRVYTISSRGDMTATAAPNLPFLDNTANR